MQDHAPVLSNPVTLFDKPELMGDEVPARKATAWAMENTGTPKPEIDKQIEKMLRN
jgi:hypothetical protein